MDYLITLALITLSALFSGLTLGILSLDSQTLKRKAKGGDLRAQAVYPIRKKGNLLLTTLLLGNVVVNTTLSIFLGSLASGIVAVCVATVLIFLFGEIIPQAVISRHALWFGAKAAPFVKITIWIFYPVAAPISWMLDKMLGQEIPNIYSHHELMQIVSEHGDSEHSSIDKDEERIIHGALKFSHRTVREVMTPREEIVMFDENQRLTESFFKQIADVGYSRYPVFSGNETNIIGILFAKDLLIEDENITIKNTEEALEVDILTTKTHNKLDILLAKMIREKKHMAVVYNRKNQFVGVITLEDIIEEILQLEIEDEED